jgi:hypothetical protein
MRKLHKKTKLYLLIGIGLLLLIIGGLAFYLYSNNGGQDKIDYDCSDFDTQQAAQKYFNSQGGSSRKNVDNLDFDRDGIACESLSSNKDSQQFNGFNFLKNVQPGELQSNPNEPTFQDIADGKAYLNPRCTESNGQMDYDKFVQGGYGNIECWSFTPYSQ